MRYISYYYYYYYYFRYIRMPPHIYTENLRFYLIFWARMRPLRFYELRVADPPPRVVAAPSSVPLLRCPCRLPRQIRLDLSAPRCAMAVSMSRDRTRARAQEKLCRERAREGISDRRWAHFDAKGRRADPPCAGVDRLVVTLAV
jgi:hypothetical protein